MVIHAREARALSNNRGQWTRELGKQLVVPTTGLAIMLFDEINDHSSSLGIKANGMDEEPFYRWLAAMWISAVHSCSTAHLMLNAAHKIPFQRTIRSEPLHHCLDRKSAASTAHHVHHSRMIAWSYALSATCITYLHALHYAHYEVTSAGHTVSGLLHRV